MSETEMNKSSIDTANIMVAGKTGTGKSTLLNAVFASELATTGTGRPVTDHIHEYEHEDIPIHIWDTVGLELDSEKTKKSIEEIKKTIAQRAEENDDIQQIHAIWYCINSSSNRYEGAELDFIKELYSIGVPFTIVLTQCFGAKKKIAEFENVIKEINAEMGLDKIEIVQVLAQEYEIEIDEDNIVKKAPFGLEDLVDITLERLPEYVQSGFIAAQKVNKSLKHQECEKMICEYKKRVEDNYWSKLKIVNWDNIPIINFLTTNGHIKELFTDVGKIYNTKFDEKTIDNVVHELGGVDLNKAVQILLNPSTKKFDAEIKNLFGNNTNGNFNDEFKSLSSKQRAARMMVFYGYIFLQALENTWKLTDEKHLEEMAHRGAILVEEVKKAFKMSKELKNE